MLLASDDRRRAARAHPRRRRRPHVPRPAAGGRGGCATPAFRRGGPHRRAACSSRTNVPGWCSTTPSIRCATPTGGVSGVVAFSRDHTARRRAEAEVERLNAQLRTRVTELERLLALTPVGVAIAEDPECRVMRANAALQRLLGVPADDERVGDSVRASAVAHLPGRARAAPATSCRSSAARARARGRRPGRMRAGVRRWPRPEPARLSDAARATRTDRRAAASA